MSRSRLPLLLLALLLVVGCASTPPPPATSGEDAPRLWGPLAPCDCDHSRPESLADRNCALCRVVEAREGGLLLVKDIDPEKPNRWLALPRRHAAATRQSITDLSGDERRELAAFSVREAERLFPGRWALAVNPAAERSQCHLHVHLGPRRDDALCTNAGIHVGEPGRILDAVASDGSVWAHPEPGGGYHVHTAVAVEGMLER